MFCLHRQDNWADLLPLAEFAYNNHHHPSVDTTPFFANYGYHLMLMNILTGSQSGPPDKHIWWIHESQTECKQVIKQSQEVSRRAYDRWKRGNPRFEVGNCVWLEATNLATDEPLLKLTSKRHSPFPIKDKLLELTSTRTTCPLEDPQCLSCERPFQGQA